jgi:single-stranded-DNA-specific exonuclease
MKKIIRRRALAANPCEIDGLPYFLKRAVAARGVTDAKQLRYELAQLLKPSLKGLDDALELLLEVLQRQGRVMIVGDFDADGATSTAVAVRSLRAMGYAHVEFIVPNRFEYGYGLSPEIVEVAAQWRPDLIITVDNGISSIDGVDRAHELGIKVLVTDHHLPGQQLPTADAIVNPNQDGCLFESKAAAGVGVIFYVMMALRGRLRSQGWFTQREEPNLASFLDLVALGTVADVVPLDFNNRIMVAQGLQRIRAGVACAGIRALLAVAGRDANKIVAADLGFAIAPRLNAAGRLDDMTLGIRCLLADSDAEAMNIAHELDQLNRDRRSIENLMQTEALHSLEQLNAELDGQLPQGLCLYREDWHQGVIGILASRIKDRLHRPVIVFADDGHGALKGSGRSISGIHLRDILDEVATSHPGLLSKFGGHAMAAGLSLEKAHLDEFSRAFNQVVKSHLGEDGLEAKIDSDGELDAADLSLDSAERIQLMGPWGQAFTEPVFDGEFRLIQQKLVGEKHLKMTLAHVNDEQNLIDAIAFNVDRNLWPSEDCDRVKLAYKLSINEFRGRRSLQLMVDYLEEYGS